MRDSCVIGYWLNELFVEKKETVEVVRYHETTGKPRIVKQTKLAMYLGELSTGRTCRECSDEFFGEDLEGPFVYDNLRGFDVATPFDDVKELDACFVGCSAWENVKVQEFDIPYVDDSFKINPYEIDLRDISDKIHNEAMQWLRAIVPNLPANYELPKPSLYMMCEES